MHQLQLCLGACMRMMFKTNCAFIDSKILFISFVVMLFVLLFFDCLSLQRFRVFINAAVACVRCRFDWVSKFPAVIYCPNSK